MKVRGEKAFTLIELLVVIAIIGLLSTIVLTSLASARSKARDVRRKADLEQIAKALELYRTTYGGYPSSVYPSGTTYIVGPTIGAEPKMAQFMPQTPLDPGRANNCYNNAYLYLSNVYNDGSGNNARATKYRLIATLEDQSSNNLSTSDGEEAWLRAGGGSCGGAPFPNYKLERAN